MTWEYSVVNSIFDHYCLIFYLKQIEKDNSIRITEPLLSSFKVNTVEPKNINDNKQYSAKTHQVNLLTIRLREVVLSYLLSFLCDSKMVLL
jgi:hypothetical protein